jgi:outer membrane protein assembly factor BamB
MRDVMIAQPVYAAGVQVNGVATDVIYEGTEHGDFYALAAATGKLVWHRTLGEVETTCSDMPDRDFGVGSTAALDRASDSLYVAGGDGMVYSLNLATGADRTGWPVANVFTPSQEHVYGGILFDPIGKIYVTTASHCDIAPYHGKIAEIDVRTHRVSKSFFPASTAFNGGGIWGPGGVSQDSSNGHIFVATGNALTDPENYLYSDGVVELTNSLAALGHNSPPLSGGDVDFGATPLLYQAAGCPAQLVAKNKSGVMFVYKRGAISAGPAQSLQISDTHGHDFNGIPAFSPVTNTVYVTNDDESSSGIYKHGLVALKVQSDCTLKLAWQSVAGPASASVSPPSVANGVVYYGDGLGKQLLAYNAATGKKLWDSGGTISGDIFAAPTVADGKVFGASWDNRIYAFGP